MTGLNEVARLLAMARRGSYNNSCFTDARPNQLRDGGKNFHLRAEVTCHPASAV
jgi:hypothetical protein